MKKIAKSIVFSLGIVGFLGFTACEKSDGVAFDREFSGIYFHQDSLYYSFGVTGLEVEEYVWEVPLFVMGGPQSEARPIEIRIDPSNTNAEEGVHYRMPENRVVMADSVAAYIPIDIVRETLGEEDYTLTLTLVENEFFRPVNEPRTQVTLYFNNRVERPNWLDYAGRPTWPSDQLGPWNPTTYIKFIELFRELEDKSPVSYQNMVNEFGPDLERLTFGWPWDYNYTMIKYVLIPLYQYFMEENPELGVTIPRPDNY